MFAHIAHFTKMAFKAFYRFKLHTIISLFSLVFGFLCFIAASLFADYVNSFDQHFPNAENIYTLIQVGTSEDSPFDEFPIMHEPAARYLRAAFPEMDNIVRATTSNTSDVTFDGQTDSFAVRFVEPEFLDIFPIALLNGTAGSVDLPPGSILISEAAAMRRFGTTSVIGRFLTIDNQVDLVIGDVFADFEQPSHLDSAISLFKTDMLAHIDAYDRIWGGAAAANTMNPATDRWGNQSYYVDLQVPAAAAPPIIR